MIFQNKNEHLGITHRLEVKQYSNLYFIDMYNLFNVPDQNTYGFIVLNQEEIDRLITELQKLKK